MLRPAAAACRTSSSPTQNRLHLPVPSFLVRSQSSPPHTHTHTCEESCSVFVFGCACMQSFSSVHDCVRVWQRKRGDGYQAQFFPCKQTLSKCMRTAPSSTALFFFFFSLGDGCLHVFIRLRLISHFQAPCSRRADRAFHMNGERGCVHVCVCVFVCGRWRVMGALVPRRS